MTDLSEERLAELIALLPPAPQGWVEAAIELPRVSAAIDDLATRAMADRQTRQAILADLEEAVRAAGVEPRPKLVESLRARLSGPD
jgi:hypothetical protein